MTNNQLSHAGDASRGAPKAGRPLWADFGAGERQAPHDKIINMKKLTVTIGIPAYNEANNIASLLDELLKQKLSSTRLVGINVISDGSTDKTVKEVKKKKSGLIHIFEYKKSVGPAIRQDQLIAMTRSDILILLNADIVISDQFFLEKLVAPIISKKAHLTSAAIYELESRTFFESVLQVSMRLKRVLFDSIKNGNNLYNCHGPARAFSRSLYQKLHFKMNEGEDMYSYIMCLKHHFKFVYVRDAHLFYSLPANFGDHLKQSVRYLKAQSLLGKVASVEFAQEELRIPWKSIFDASIKAVPIIIRFPLQTLVYLGILLVVEIYSYIKIVPTATWNVRSSKFIRVKV